MQPIIIFLLGGMTLLLISVERTYRSVPVKELKRRARRGDDFASLLFRAASYGYSLRFVLWFLIGLVASIFFVAVSRNLPLGTALLVSALLVWVGFVWAPARKVTRTGRLLVRLLAPALEKAVYYLHPVVSRVAGFIGKYRHIRVHTGLYEKEDLIQLIEDQKSQTDNRIDYKELDMAFRALTFNEKYVRNYLTPRRVVKMVDAEESIGPLLMDELHKSGHSRFPVYADSEDNIVGTLYLRDLMNVKHGGSVRQSMRKEVSYIHEDESLHAALQAILKTRHHMLIVVNNFEEYAGILTVEDALEQIIGEPIIDEFDQYDDLRAVAARQAAAEHEVHTRQREAAMASRLTNTRS